MPGRSDSVNEYALAGANERGLHHGVFMARLDKRGGPGAARVVQDLPRLTDIRDAVLEQGEYIVTVVHTEPVARAEILVNPHAHFITILLHPLP
mgnify:CR=1 FL=1